MIKFRHKELQERYVKDEGFRKRIDADEKEYQEVLNKAKGRKLMIP